ncbi:MAG: bifunctional 4-hydroxy-2-oxoglutarate aldolase/2-dehydro-3-deoxy-phosphogluconate aldolase [Clostridia bacterium]|nr:bifunctional 4-hydroxy-2-oxoglutarate aldolase/2-dehydro-3-deoxy-phosphogluconate aldolase [Clostridia bacterium]
MKEQILKAIQKERLIVILRGIQSRQLLPLTEALYAGGIRLLEITYSANGTVPDEETAAQIALLASHFKNRMFIGAGTVLTEKQVELTRNAGGGFIISPDTYEPVIQKTKALGMVSIPGALTPSEITAAHRAGADLVKLFPVTSLGSAYVKAVRAPLSHIPLLAVGGVDETNMEEYLRAGIAGFGVGSNITDKKMLEKENYEGMEALAKSYTAVIKQWQTT